MYERLEDIKANPVPFNKNEGYYVSLDDPDAERPF